MFGFDDDVDYYDDERDDLDDEPYSDEVDFDERDGGVETLDESLNWGPSQRDDFTFDPRDLNVPNGFMNLHSPDPIGLQIAAEFKKTAERRSDDSALGRFCLATSDAISGAQFPGVDGIRSEVAEASLFFGTERPNVFYMPGRLGVQWNGWSSKAYDNWIGGDPEKLNDYALEYGDDFVSCVMGHETGHNVVDRLGLSDETSRLANEVAADRLAGIYAGSKGLDKSGIVDFFRNQPVEGVFDDDGTQIYLGGEERAREFEEGYAEGVAMTKAYPWRSFESFVHDPRFDLRGYVRKIAERFR